MSINKYSLEQVIKWHKEESERFKAFGVDNILCQFHNQAASLIEQLRYFWFEDADPKETFYAPEYFEYLHKVTHE